VLPLPEIELFLCSFHVGFAVAEPTAADDDDVVVNYVDGYDFASAASLFVEFRNRFGPYQLVP